jgi:hypothetical protein
MLEAYEKKYKSNTVMTLKAMVFHKDINFNEPVKMMGKNRFEWKTFENRLRLMLQLPNKVFEAL